MRRTWSWILSLVFALIFVSAAAESSEPSSAGNGLMPADQLLRLIKWVDSGYYRNMTYEEIVAVVGVEGLDRGHRDTSMTALGDHYFDWISESDPTHFIHICFRGRDQTGRFEACQWNTSGFNSGEWSNADISDWLPEPAAAVTATPAPIVTTEPVPVSTATPVLPSTPQPVITPEPTPLMTEAPDQTDAYWPDDPIVFVASADPRQACWTEYAFTNELNGITLTFCMPMEAETAVSDFYAKKDPSFQDATGKAYFYWRYDAAGHTKMNTDITLLYPTAKEHEIKSAVAHGSGASFTVLKTDRGITLYRRVNDRGEYRWVILSDPLSDGSRVVVQVEIANSGKAGEPWYEAITTAFEGTVTLTVPGEQLQSSELPVAASAQPTVTPVPTEAPPTPMPSEQPAAADISRYMGTWYSTWLHTAAMEGDPRSQYGFTVILTLNEDGTGELDYLGSDGGGRWGADEDGIVRYWGSGTALTLLEDGSLCWGTVQSGYILFSCDSSAQAAVFPDEHSPQPAATAQPADHTASESNGSAGFVGTKYVGKTYMAGGMSMDASVLGGEYAIRMNADGTANFTMAGMEMTGYHWAQTGQLIEIDAYGTVVMTLAMQPDGSILMDYSGAFQLIMFAE